MRFILGKERANGVWWKIILVLAQQGQYNSYKTIQKYLNIYSKRYLDFVEMEHV